MNEEKNITYLALITLTGSASMITGVMAFTVFNNWVNQTFNLLGQTIILAAQSIYLGTACYTLLHRLSHRYSEQSRFKQYRCSRCRYRNE